MKLLISTAFAFTAFLSTVAQTKYDYIHFNKLTELKGTEYVIATIDNRSKTESLNKYLLFINTENGETYQVDFPKDAYINKIEQVKLDNLGINKVVVVARTVNLDKSKSIDWSDPQQVIVLSTDGQQKTQLTDDKFFTRTWTSNSETGRMVIVGYFDTNNNGKYDKTDKNEILIYDLKTLNLVSKI